MSVLSSFIEKNYLRFYKYFIAGKTHKYFYKGKKPLPPKVVFYLYDKKVVHLGDTLWFEPIAKFLTQYYDVSIYPNQSMEFYFRQLGYKIATLHELNDDCILITFRELMYKLRNYKNVLYLNFDYRLIDKDSKLIDSMVEAAAEFFELPYKKQQWQYQKLVFSEDQVRDKQLKFNMSMTSRYIIFNNYIDSWGKHTTQDMLDAYQLKLINYAKSFKSKNPNIGFIYVGSQQDLNNGRFMNVDFIDIDLRGQTDVEDLFVLAQSAQVEAYIGFDTFLLHLFNMYDKPSHILLKPGQRDNINKLLIDHVLVPYSKVDNESLILIDPNSL